MRNARVLDAYAVLAWVLREPGWSHFEELLNRSNAGELHLAASVINFGEVYYRLWREHGRAAALRTIADLGALGVERIPASDDLVWSAAGIKAEHAVSYADAFAIATALELDAPIVTNDPEIVACGLVEIDWQEE